jgi:hypothetical protein
MKVLMSVDRANKSQSMNAANRALFEKFLSKQGYEWEKVIGCYQEKGQDKPQREQSYLISPVHHTEENTLLDMAWLFEQYSVLLIGESGTCYLTDSVIKYYGKIGKWTKVTEEEAKANGHYIETKDGYFIAR